MVTGDGAYIKKINRSLILKEIVKHGYISRADLSKTTGLNKATISVQVSDLLEEKLVYETKHEHQAIGRRPIMLSINAQVGYVLGIDLDYPTTQFTISDLAGTPVEHHIIQLDTKDYNTVTKLIADQIDTYKERYSHALYGLISAIIGVHGTINTDESLHFIPKFNWRKKDLKATLLQSVDLPITIENNANLAAYSERVYNHHQDYDLLSILLTSGIGVGIIINGGLYKGYHGYAGEMGHMIISPDGKPCSCGNHGCWERYASEPRILDELSVTLNKPNLSFDDIQEFIDEQNLQVVECFKRFIKYLAIGINNIINMHNPETIVLNSKLLKLYPKAIEELKSHLNCSISRYRNIVLSDLADRACVLGACALAIEQFLEVPELILTIPEAALHLEATESPLTV
ncbi:ROK family transcriptional regulator [Oceanobacillus piezotolerans]|uniref:ROK family transcriptional regulator n=1 Tax=Oceanobacillus piezotolerans TaxID=2448030 RepID=A0A498D4N3_9BACI|nr:ROK family transcriptional regulator [Oceanobacillus piezotolerans]RLL40703.1 ROK family transcriptional regulator [Oceanobacillus piezotolerans]